MSASVSELLAIKKARYAELRERFFTGQGRLFNSEAAIEVQVLLMEIEYLEQRPDATPEEVEFMEASSDE